MIMDELLEFCDAESVAASAGTALVGDVINSQDAKDLGMTGMPVYLVISVSTAIITGGAAGTIQFKLASDATASIQTDGSATDHWISPTFVTDDAALNDLDIGDYVARVPLPMESESQVTGRVYEAFLGILVVTATTTTTAGAINAFLTLQPPKHASLPDAAN